MGYRTKTIVWVGVSANEIVKIVQMGPGRDYNNSCHRFQDKLYKRIVGERGKPVPEIVVDAYISVLNNNGNWAFLIDNEILLEEYKNRNFPDDCNIDAISEDSRILSDIGWGVIVGGLSSSGDQKEVYDKAERLKEVFKIFVEKYCTDDEKTILLENMDVHTESIVI